MKKTRLFLTFCALSIFSYTANVFADVSHQDDLVETKMPTENVSKGEKVAKAEQEQEMEKPIDKEAIGAKRVSEDPTEHSIAHNTHQATKSILHDTHQGTKAIVHGTTNGIKEGTNFVTGSIADGVSKGSSAVSDFFNKIGGH